MGGYCERTVDEFEKRGMRMAVMDEFEEERNSIKSAPLNKRVEYFWNYYKWHTITAIVAIIVAVTLVHDLNAVKEVAFEAVFVNTYATSESVELVESGFAEYIQVDTDSQDVILDADYYLDYVNQGTDHTYYLQKIATLFASQTVDNVLSDEYTYAELAYSGMIAELGEYLTQEQLDKYADQLVYMDMDVKDIITELNEDMDSEVVYPEYTIGSAENMTSPVVVGIYLGEEHNLGDDFINSDTVFVVGIAASTERADVAVEFLEYVLEENNK